MPKALERKLKRQYGEDSDVPYKIMNDMGLMHGNKVVYAKKGKKKKRGAAAQAEALKG